MTDIETRKKLGMTHLHANRVDEALEVYTAILRDYPEDKEARVYLGDCYLAAGHGKTAISIYKEVLETDPENIDLQQRLMLAEDETSGRGVSDSQSDDEEISTNDNLPQTSVLPIPEVTEEDLNRGRILLRTVFSSTRPSEEIDRNLEQIEELLPAILELNRHQAQNEGQWDLAREIESFVAELYANGHFEKAQNFDTIPMKIEPQAAFPQRTDRYKILILTPFPEDSSNPLIEICAGIQKLGEEPQVWSPDQEYTYSEFDLVIAHDPHIDSRLSKIMAACAGSRVPIIVYLDQDFENLPEYHPLYESLALNQAGKIRDYNIALKLADYLVVPNQKIYQKYSNDGFRVQMIQNGWNNDNELWDKPAPRRHSVNIGWIGNSGSVEEINSIRRAVVRAMREFPETTLVITGVPEAYQLFDAVSEPRRLYLPPVEPQDFPYQLAHVDILLIPRDDNPENSLADDQLLVEAGVRKIPWIASPLDAYTSWGTGGLIAENLDDWHNSLRKLILDTDLRSSLGEEGFQSASRRELSVLSRQWLDLIDHIKGMDSGGFEL